MIDGLPFDVGGERHLVSLVDVLEVYKFVLSYIKKVLYYGEIIYFCNVPKLSAGEKYLLDFTIFINIKHKARQHGDVRTPR